MSRYLLDTTALIDFSKGRDPARQRILEMIEAGDELGVCAINVAEFYSGIEVGKHPDLDAFIDLLGYWDITREVARQAGLFRYAFARKGMALSTADTLIAAVAWQTGATIITNNVKHYPMEDIKLLPLSS